MAVAQTTAVRGTATEIIEYLQNHDEQYRYILLTEPGISAPSGEIGADEEESILDELGAIARGRLDPTLKYDRDDIYFDRRHAAAKGDKIGGYRSE
jgi:hypothetical protein